MFCVLINFTVHCFGQSDTTKVLKDKARLGFAIGGVAAETTEGLDTYTYITIQKGKNYFGVGPVYTILNTGGMSNHNFNTLGLEYKRTPFLNAPRFDLFFFTQVLLFQRRSYYYSYGSTKPDTYTSRYILMTLGYGAKLKVTDRFYLNSYFGIGYFKGSTEYGPNYLNGKGTYEDFTSSFNLGFGFKF